MTLTRGDLLARSASATRLVAAAEPLVREPLARFRLRPGDRALVRPGEPVAIGQPVMTQARETMLLEMPVRGDYGSLVPGSELDPALVHPTRGAGRTPLRPGDQAYLLYVGADRVARVVLARAPMPIISPIDGVAHEVTASQLTLRATGVGLRGPVAWGQPVVGRVILAVPTPDAELRSGAVDISAAGGILVAGARLDIEALTRARAIGVAGIICGGVVGRELQQVDESDQRQRASVHALTPFAILALDGFGRRPIPTYAWDLLAAAAADERLVGILPDARLAVVGGDPATLPIADWPADAVRIAAGDGAGRTGRLVGLAGPIRRPGGAYQPAGHVAFGATSEAPAGRRLVALADLERLGGSLSR
jgi:hypothetical protein